MSEPEKDDSFIDEHEHKLRERLKSLRWWLGQARTDQQKYKHLANDTWENIRTAYITKDPTAEDLEEQAYQYSEAEGRASKAQFDYEDQIADVNAELTEHVLRRATKEALKNIEGFSKDTRDAINQGKITNRIMVVIAALMLVLAFLTWLNTRNIREEPEIPVIETVPLQDEPSAAVQHRSEPTGSSFFLPLGTAS